MIFCTWIDAFLLVSFPHDIKPSHVSAEDYSLCMDVQESVHILCVVICITHEHACLTPVIQFGSYFLSFMYGNHCHFSKCSQTSRILCILSIEQCVRVFFLSGLTIMLSSFVAMEITSHQNSSLYFGSSPA